MQHKRILQNQSITVVIAPCLALLTIVLVYYHRPQSQSQRDPRLSEKLPHPFDFSAGRRPGSLIFDGRFPQAPAEMMVYKVVHPDVTETYV